MPELPRPYELLELGDGRFVEFHPRGFAEGTLRIFPQDWNAQVDGAVAKGRITADQAVEAKRDGKLIPVLRILVDSRDKPLGSPYWDITSTTLIPTVLPYLQDPGYKGKSFTITAVGVGLQKRFGLVVKP
jgi:hypothetical protein